MRLLPREEKFYELFQKQVEVISQASRLMLEGFRSGKDRLGAAAVEIETLERKGDEIIHDIFTRLNQTFITPIDPEDIHSISSRLDDVLDGIEEAAHCVVSYRIEPIPRDIIAMAEVVDSCANALARAFHALENDGPIMEHCIEVNRLENEGDQIERAAVATLFNSETNPITLIKLKECYDVLEQTIDCCEDVADVLQSVVLKNS